MNGFVPVVWFSQYAPYHKMPEGAIPAEWMPVMTEDTQRAQVPPWQRTLAIGAGAQPIGAREGRSPNEKLVSLRRHLGAPSETAYSHSALRLCLSRAKHG